MSPLPEHRRDPWKKLSEGREGKPQGGLGTILLLFVFFTLIGAIGVLELTNPGTIPFAFPLFGRIARLLIALACIWVALVGYRITLRTLLRRD